MRATVAETLGQFAFELDYDDLPGPVLEKLRAHVLDSLGSQIVGAMRPSNQVIRDYAIAESPDGPSAFVGVIQRGRPEWAALANGTFGHGFESDDTHILAQLHPGAVTVPTAFAVGEDVGASDRSLLTAIALGYEVAIRIGAAAEDGIVNGRGVHPMSSVGPFGAAIVATKLRDLSAAQTTAALAIAGSHSSGTMEFTQTGGEVKRLHAGLANMAGIRSASLAAAGLTAPRSIFEGTRGFYNAFSSRVDLEALTADLGKKWLMLDTEIKLYSACSLIHASLRAIQDMVATEGLLASDVELITCGVNHEALWAVGRVGPHPRNMQEAQFSLHYSVGLALVQRGNDYEHYVAAEREGFQDAATRAIAEKVKVELDADADAAFPEAFFSRVTVARRSGPPLSRYLRAAGSKEDPISLAQVRDKFRSTGRVALGQDRSARLDAIIASLPNESSCREVTSILQAAGTPDGRREEARIAERSTRV